MSSVTLSPEQMSARTRLMVLPHLRHWILIPVILSVLTLMLGFAVTWTPSIMATEFRFDQLLSRNHDGPLNAIALGVDTAFAPSGIIAILAVIFLYLLLIRRSPVNAVAVCSVAAIGWLSSEIFKIIVAEPRPNSQLLQNPLLASDGSDSFPSGHTTFAVAVAIALYFLARNTKWSTFAFIGGLVFALAVAASRIYLGVHYPSDTLGSFLVAITAITFYAGLWNRYGLAVLHRVPFLSRFGPIPPAANREQNPRLKRARRGHPTTP